MTTDEGLSIIVDTGAEVSLIKKGILGKLPANCTRRSEHEGPSLVDVNNQPIPTYGRHLVKVRVMGETIEIPVIEVNDNLKFNSNILLGMDAISLNQMQLDFKQNRIKIKGKYKDFESGISMEEPKYIRNIQVPNHNRKAPIKVRVLFDQKVAPKSMTVVQVRLTNGKNDNFLLTPYHHYYNMIDEGLLKTDEKGYGQIQVENNNSIEVTLKKNAVIGRAEDLKLVELDPSCVETKILGVKTKDQGEIRKEIEPYVQCEGEEKEDLVKLLSKFRDVIALPGEPLGRTHLTELSLRLVEGTKPIALAPYKIPHSKEEKLNEEIDKLIAQGSVRPSVSPWSFPVVLVNKPDGSIRLCVDYRKLNQVTVGDSYPLPIIDDLIMELGDAKIFSQLDLVQAYHQVPLAEDSRQLTAFRTKSHHLEYVVAPFGLKQMPAVFQRLMNRIFNVHPTRKNVSVYLDDLLVHSGKREEHLTHLEDVLGKLRVAGLKIKLSKCNFFRNEVKYLGYSITDDGFKPQEEKVLAIKKFQTPKSVDDIRSFLGMAGYYRAYIPKFSEIAKPMTAQLKKDSKFEWNKECEAAFNELKECLSSAPVLAYPDFKRPFILETDASGYGIGGVLCQEDPNVRNRLRPISYTSRLLKGAELNYSTTEKEALAAIHALKKFKFVIYGYQTTVITDHKPLVSLFANTLPPGRLGRWALMVQAYKIDFKYKPGILNKVSDCLSRYPLTETTEDPVTEVGAVQLVQTDRPNKPMPTWTIERLIKAQQEDNTFGPIYQYCSQSRAEKPPPPSRRLPISGFIVKGDVLYYNDGGKELRQGQKQTKVVVPQELVGSLLRLYHDLPTAGHRGVESTIDRIEAKYVVLGLRAQVQEYVENCERCAQFRTHSKQHTPKFQYQVSPIPFHQVHFDILGPLTTSSEGCRYIIVYVDRFTRYTIVDALPDKATKTVAKSLFEKVVVPYSTPKILISDNALEFTSKLIEDLCAFLKIKKAEITPYMPAANGLAESANKRILNVLRTAVNKSQKNWQELLPQVQVALNTAYHAAIGDTPHYLLFLRDKLLPFEVSMDEVEDGTEDDYVGKMNERLRIAVEAANKNLMEEERRYTVKRNRGAKEYPVKVGYRVYLKNRQLQKRGLAKLSPKWEGPYRVMSDLGRQRFLVKSLVSGKEKRVHAEHTKIVPETCCSRDMNHNVRTPFPGLMESKTDKSDSDQSDEELILISNHAGVNRELSQPVTTGELQETGDVDDHRRPDDDISEGGGSDPVLDDDHAPPTETGPLTQQNEVRSGHDERRYNLRKRKEVRYRY